MAFDPTQPFEIVSEAEAAPVFDPTQPFEIVSEEQATSAFDPTQPFEIVSEEEPSYFDDFTTGLSVGLGRLGTAVDVVQNALDPSDLENQRELAQRLIEVEQEQTANPYSQETLRDMEEFSKVEGLWDGIKYLVTNPGVTGILAAENLAQIPLQVGGVIAGSLAGGAVGSAVAPGPGSAVGAAVGAFVGRGVGAGLPSYVLEYSGVIQEELTARGQQTTEENIMSGFQDPEFMKNVRERANARGLSIASFDMLTGGLAGTLYRPVAGALAKAGAPTVGKLAGVAGELGVQTAGGMGGEAVAQLRDPKYGYIHDWSAIAAEGVLEFLMSGPAEVGGAVLSRPSRDRLPEDINAILNQPPPPVPADQDSRVPVEDGGETLSETQAQEMERIGAPRLAEALRSLSARVNPDDPASPFVFEPEYSMTQHKNIQDLVDFVGTENIGIIEPVIEFANDPLTGSAGGATFSVGGQYFSGLDGSLTGKIQVDPRQFPISTLWHEHKHHVSAVLRKLDPEAHKRWISGFKPAKGFKAGLSGAVQRAIGRDMVDAFDQRLQGVEMTSEELMAHAFQAYKEAEGRNLLPSQRQGAKPGVIGRAFDAMSNYLGRVVNVLSGRGMTQVDAFNYVLDGGFMKNLNVQLGRRGQEQKSQESAQVDTQAGEREGANVQERKDSDRMSFDTGEVIPGVVAEVQTNPKKSEAPAESADEAQAGRIQTDAQIIQTLGGAAGNLGFSHTGSVASELTDESLRNAQTSLRRVVSTLEDPKNSSAPNAATTIEIARRDLETVGAVLQDRQAKYEAQYFPVQEQVRGPVDGVTRLAFDTGDVLYSALVQSGGKLYPSVDSSPAKAKGKTYQPKQTVKAYKLFKRFKRTGDALHPLFVKMPGGKPLPMGEWVEAEFGTASKKEGKVKSSLGDLAFRPGFHAGDLPIATHIGGRVDVSTGASVRSESMPLPNIRKDDQVWAEVEFAADTDWQSVADSRATFKNDGTVDVKTAHITDQLPKEGFYRYKTNPNMTGNWLIGGDMKINRVLSREEVQTINAASGVTDLPTFSELRQTAGLLPSSVKEVSDAPPQFSRLINDVNKRLIMPPDDARYERFGTAVSDIIRTYSDGNRLSKDLQIEGTGKNNAQATHGKDVLAKDIGKAFNGHMRQMLYAAGVTTNNETPLSLFDDAHYEIIRKGLAKELELQFRQTDSGMGWYDNDIKKVMGEAAKIYPQFKGPMGEEYKMMLTLFASPMSNGNKARKNMTDTLNNFVVWLNAWETEGVSAYPATNTLSGQIFGPRGPTIARHITLINNMLNNDPLFVSPDTGQPDINLLLQFMVSKHTVRDLNTIRKAHGIPSPLAGMARDSEVLGSYIFGQKFGPFFANMNGITDETVDAWAARSIYRHMGDMLVTSGKNKGDVINGPQGSDQPLIKNLLRDVTEDLRFSLGGGTRDSSGRAVWLSNYNRDFSSRDVQAMLWFYEKDLWNALGYKTAKDVYSDGAADSVASFNEDFKGAIKDAGQSPGTQTTPKADYVRGVRNGAAILKGALEVAVARGASTGKIGTTYQSAQARREVHAREKRESAARARRGSQQPAQRVERPADPEPTVLYSRITASASSRLARRNPQERAWSVTRSGGGLGGYGVDQGAVATYRLNESEREALEAEGITAPTMVESTPQRFFGLIQDAANSTPAGAAVYIYPQEDYAGMRLFTTEDGTAGFALKGDDIVSVFKHRRSPVRRATVSMLRLAVEEGGRKLDAFDTVLPQLYGESGFKVASRLPWDDSEAPPSWDKNSPIFSSWNGGEPDVVFMYHDPVSTRAYSPSDGQYAAGYDEAVDLQTGMVEQIGKALQPMPDYTQGTRGDAKHSKVAQTYEDLNLETVNEDGTLQDIDVVVEDDIVYGIIPPQFSMLVNGIVPNKYASRQTPLYGRRLSLSDFDKLSELWEATGFAFRSAADRSKEKPGIAYPVGRGGPNGYGRKHVIERGHVEELRQIGFKDDIEALDYVSRRYRASDMHRDNVREGNVRIDVDKRVGNLTHKVRVVTQMQIDNRTRIPFLGVVTMFPIMAKSVGDAKISDGPTRGKRKVDKPYQGALYSTLTNDPMTEREMALADLVGQRKPSMVRRIFSDLRDLVSGARSVNVTAELFDAYAPARRYTEKGYKRLRLANDTASIVAESVVGGPPNLTDRGFVDFTDAQGNEIRKPSLLNILQGITKLYGDMGLHLFGAYTYAVRARRLITEKNADGTSREKLLKAGEIAQLLELGRKYPEFEKARLEYIEFNNVLLDNAVTSGLLSKEEAASWKKYGDYVPFYRADIDPKTMKGRALEQDAKGGVGRVGKASRELTGSALKTQGIVPNMIRNTEYLINKTVRNLAMDVMVKEIGPKSIIGGQAKVLTEVTQTYVKAAKTSDDEIVRSLKAMLGDEHPLLDNIEAELQAQRDNPNAPASEALTLYKIGTFEPREQDANQKVIHVRRDGKSQFYRVDDEELFRALTYIPTRNLNRFMRVMNFQRMAFSQMITKVPDFLMANLMRDTLSTRALHGGYEPITAAMAGAKNSLLNDQVTRELRLNGGTALGGYHTDNTLRRYKNLTGDTSNPLILTARNTWALMDRVSEAAENANRIAVFKQAKKEGADLFEAGFRARDVLDFGLTGRSGIVKALITIIPFLNARAQGSYRLARGAVQKGNRLNFLLWGSFLAAASIALRVENEDEERYKALTDTSKDLYIHFWLDRYIDKDVLKAAGIDNPHVAIPKPFEMGFISMTVPERLTSVALGEQKDEAFGKMVKSMGWGVTEIFKLNPLEALSPIGKGIAQDVFNYDWHYRRPIVPKNYEKFVGEPYEAENVNAPYASEAMKALSKVLGMAPQRTQNYMDSMFPKVGNMVMTLVDGYYREAHGLPVVPREFKRTLVGQATIGRFNPEEYPNVTQYERDLREMASEMRAIRNAITKQVKTNRIDPVGRTKELYAKHKDELAGMDVIENSLKAINSMYRDADELKNLDSLETNEKLAWQRRLARMRGDLAKQALSSVRSLRPSAGAN